MVVVVMMMMLVPVMPVIGEAGAVGEGCWTFVRGYSSTRAHHGLWRLAVEPDVSRVERGGWSAVQCSAECRAECGGARRVGVPGCWADVFAAWDMQDLITLQQIRLSHGEIWCGRDRLRLPEQGQSSEFPLLWIATLLRAGPDSSSEQNQDSPQPHTLYHITTAAHSPAITQPIPMPPSDTP